MSPSERPRSLLPAIPLKLYYQPGRIVQTLTPRKAEGQKEQAMSIQMFKDLQEATDNAKAMVEGLKGLGEHIFPADKLHKRVDDAIVPYIDRFASDLQDNRDRMNKTVLCCEQQTNEVTQLANSITARYEERFRAIEVQLSAIEDILEGFIAAAGRRRR